MDPAAIDTVLRTRRTISLFKPECPPVELLHRAIELARWAPNHRMTQPWRFYLLGPETIAKIVHLNSIVVGEKKGPGAAASKLRQWSAIPGWLIVTCGRSEDGLREREDYAACACAIHTLALFLWSHGVGVKWTTGDVTRDPRFYDLLNVDAAQEFVVGMVWYGYPADIPVTKRKPVEEILIALP